MCVRTHVLFNSYLMYVNHFNTREFNKQVQNYEMFL